MSLPDSTAQRLRAQHGCISTLLACQGSVDIHKRPSLQKWSIVEHIAHLYAYQPIFSRRVGLILSQDNPSFDPYVGDHDPVFLEAREQPIGDLLTDLASDRQYLFEWLISLSDRQWTRGGTHKRYGQRSLLMWTEFFLLHEAHHCDTIWKLM